MCSCTGKSTGINSSGLRVTYQSTTLLRFFGDTLEKLARAEMNGFSKSIPCIPFLSRKIWLKKSHSLVHCVQGMETCNGPLLVPVSSMELESSVMIESYFV